MPIQSHAPTERQREQRTLSWALYTSLGAAANAYSLHRRLARDLDAAEGMMEELQSAIVALNSVAEAAHRRLVDMKEQNRG